MEKRNCQQCNKIFSHRISKGKNKGKYCSVLCQRKSKKTSIMSYCLLCKKQILVQPYRFKSGRGKFCSIKCRANGVNDETKRKMSLKRKGIPTGRTGDKCHFWKGGITPVNKKIRMSLETRIWREAVFKRDNWTCVLCNIKGGKLQSDHIKPFAKYPELRFAIDNGRALCIDCHKKTDTYGRKSA